MFISGKHQKKKVVLEMFSLCNLAHFKLSKEKKRLSQLTYLEKRNWDHVFFLNFAYIYTWKTSKEVARP
jgi:hypothetical protein